MISLSKQELEQIEKKEYDILKANIGGDQYTYCIGRWGMIRELLDKIDEMEGVNNG